NVNVVITINNNPTTIPNVQILAAQPGFYTYQGPNNRLYGAVIRGLDGSYVTPSNFLRRGEPYFLVATGLGQVTPATLTNSAGIANQNVILPVTVGLNNAGITATNAQYLPGSIGVYLVQFTV